MRVSRPCYDKMHRCPGWAGGGGYYAKRDRCDSGYVVRLDPTLERGTIYEGRFWRFRLHMCRTCGVYVLPYAIRWVDPTNWWQMGRYHLRNSVRCTR